MKRTFRFIRMKRGGRCELITWSRDAKGELVATGKPHEPTAAEVARMAASKYWETTPDPR